MSCFGLIAYPRSFHTRMCTLLPVLTHRDKFDNAELERRTVMLKERLVGEAVSFC